MSWSNVICQPFRRLNGSEALTDGLYLPDVLGLAPWNLFVLGRCFERTLSASKKTG